MVELITSTIVILVLFTSTLASIIGVIMSILPLIILGGIFMGLGFAGCAIRYYNNGFNEASLEDR